MMRRVPIADVAETPVDADERGAAGMADSAGNAKAAKANRAILGARAVPPQSRACPPSPERLQLRSRVPVRIGIYGIGGLQSVFDKSRFFTKG